MSTYIKTIQEAYVAYYGRPGDPGGVAYWADRLEKAAGSLAEIIGAFGDSAEFVERYGNLSFSELVNSIYQQCFNRDAEAGGLNYYVTELQEGRKTLQSITLDVLYGAQNEDKDTVDRKVEFAELFTSQVESGAIQYSGTQAAESAKGVLGTVGSNFMANEFASFLTGYNGGTDNGDNGNNGGDNGDTGTPVQPVTPFFVGDTADTLISLAVLNNNSGILSTQSLRDSIVAQTGVTAYNNLFDPTGFPGFEDGTFSAEELGVLALGNLPATQATIESLFYGTIINAYKRIDVAEVNEMVAFSTSIQPGTIPDPQTVLDLVIGIFEDEAANPAFTDEVIATTITQTVAVMADVISITGGNVFDGVFDIV